MLEIEVVSLQGKKRGYQISMDILNDHRQLLMPEDHNHLIN